jgi:hypothetical protein
MILTQLTPLEMPLDWTTTFLLLAIVWTIISFMGFSHFWGEGIVRGTINVYGRKRIAIYLLVNISALISLLAITWMFL